MQKPTRIIDFELLARIKRMPCCLCSKESDPAHIYSRGAGGPDVEWNVIPLCRKHHSEQHQKGWVKFVNKYFSLKIKLELMGWVMPPHSPTDRLWHPGAPSSE